MKSNPLRADSSSTSAPSIAWRVASPAGLARMRAWLGAWLSDLDADAETTREIVLACSEAASDVLRGTLPGTEVDVAADWTEGHVVVRVAAHAGRRRHTSTSRHRPDPLGRLLVAASVDHVIVLRTAGGNRYLMCRCLRSGCGGSNRPAG